VKKVSDEAKQLYLFKIDGRAFCAVGAAVFAADTKEEARSMFYGLKWKDLKEDNKSNEKVDGTDEESFIDNKHTRVLFHRPERINRFMETIWYLEYEFFLRASVKKGLKSFTFSDG